ncbi:hypothetical protein PPL_07678 [Heterostelium album PN500]|uniref:Uncharacterized protein n=1 Tax=Heterostelium pallidum (strain ATCC 26659 / Pp 5 / PN500) TaxID=670386 RepID=D3BGM6_HETP5|nr:hypothetical protein PPL_07678 [Heterostelium album PN500]EFA79260.1 hypothetical protein PPL_07678 [Heterostelium album PN500]|eukprot:XP_020431381.1 hypothetical protein PPL_07678 [Heterostelium album PN500]
MIILNNITIHRIDYNGDLVDTGGQKMGGKLTKIDLKNEYYDIEKQLTTVALDIDKHLTAVLRSTDIKGLKPEHREEFQEVTTQYHHDLDKKTNNIKKISREIVLYKKKKSEASEESYSEGLKKNWKMITGGLIAAHVGALLVGLVVLHLIPIVNIVLGLATLNCRKIKGLEEMPDLNDLETFIPDIEQACINFDQVVNEQLSNQSLNITIPFINIQAQR